MAEENTHFSFCDFSLLSAPVTASLSMEYFRVRKKNKALKVIPQSQNSLQRTVSPTGLPWIYLKQWTDAGQSFQNTTWCLEMEYQVIKKAWNDIFSLWSTTLFEVNVFSFDSQWWLLIMFHFDIIASDSTDESIHFVSDGAHRFHGALW